MNETVIERPFKVSALLLSIILLVAISFAACSPRTDMSEAEAATEEPAEVVVEEEPMPEPLVVSDDVYVVSSGDNLWAISGMSSVYNDPFRWPLIYARNKDIEDADLIFPGQELSIRRDISRDDIDGAIMHAKNRGAWAIGEIEESDVQYRSSTM